MSRYTELQTNPKIKVFGSEKAQAQAIPVLEALPLTGDEYHNRLLLQETLEANGLRVELMYGGNSVWDSQKLLRNVKRIIKHNDMSLMSNYLYDFLHLSCGSIAHFNKHGWISTYPTVSDLKKFFQRNEFGQSVVSYQPLWKGDAQKAAQLIEEALSSA